MASAGSCILAEYQDSNVIRQQREAVGRASQNYRHSRIYCLLRKRQTPRWRRARKNSSLLCFFSLVPLSAPSLYTVAHFSDITAYSALPRFATGAHENPGNKVASFQRLASANISSRVSMQFSKAVCNLSSRKVIFNSKRKNLVSSERRVTVTNSSQHERATISLMYSDHSTVCKNLSP